MGIQRPRDSFALRPASDRSSLISQERAVGLLSLSSRVEPERVDAFMTTGLLLFFATMAGWREQATAFQPVPPPTSPTRLMLSSSTVQVVDNATPSSSITLSELSDRQTTQSEFIDRWVQSQDNDDDVFWS